MTTGLESGGDVECCPLVIPIPSGCERQSGSPRSPESGEDYAFGAVLVRDGTIVTASGNKVITYRDPTGHAELNCLRKAAMREGHRHLKPGAVLYTTHAPCPMCLAACVWTKLSGLVYGASQRDIRAWGREHAGPTYTWRSVSAEPEEIYRQVLWEAHPDLEIAGGFLADECRELFHD